MKKTKEFYSAFVEFDDGGCMDLGFATKGYKRKLDTYEQALEVIAIAKHNYSKKDMKRTYPDGSYEWLSYNDQHNLKYFIEKHYDTYETLYEEECPKTRKDLEKGEDSIEIAI